MSLAAQTLGLAPEKSVDKTIEKKHTFDIVAEQVGASFTRSVTMMLGLCMLDVLNTI